MSRRTRGGSYLKGVRRRKEILDQAHKAFAERGSFKMSLRAVAEELDISHATVLHYFSSLEELMLEVVALRDSESARWLETRRQEGLMGELTEAARRNVATPGLVAAYTSMMAASVEPTNALARAFFARRFANGRRALAQSIESRTQAASDSAKTRTLSRP
ncbi:helix-turn-helix domain containing protein [Rhodococcus sp. T2V]|uniref:TetR/AcrR family transcriptional regulator n=1 Tax=Rhodococcus sp. T2V TaxID=3034164 RepID=UPI0023E13B52|nr:helix-turn-helix domain-containing protein [Rhodococcus sp. T2V]MDF3312690.1 helix-turn-helix domain containing protein [Rhodococcus sp. T2V]